MSDDMVKKAVMHGGSKKQSDTGTFSEQLKHTARKPSMNLVRKLHSIKKMMASQSISELEDDVDFLHNAYNEDISAFSTTEEQLDQLEDYALENGLADLDTESDSVADGSMTKSPCT
ncbi:hypothetical protein BDN67DRAFT_983599 [Paxillus ammoniavirescens]|nr:hypothetical protein BDN67DRAFT_983599 [Paxillus ammoniavirescens]